MHCKTVQRTMNSKEFVLRHVLRLSEEKTEVNDARLATSCRYADTPDIARCSPYMQTRHMRVGSRMTGYEDGFSDDLSISQLS